jgi:hypothetical protein
VQRDVCERVAEEVDVRRYDPLLRKQPLQQREDELLAEQRADLVGSASRPQTRRCLSRGGSRRR